MQKVIEHIRNQPKQKRNRIIWYSAGFVAIALIIVWMIIGNGQVDTGGESLFQSITNEFNQAKQNYNDYRK